MTLATKEIKTIRQSLGCSQEILATIIGVGTRTIVRWEHEESHPHPIAQEKIRKIEKLTDKLLEVFSPKDAVKWLHTPNNSIDGRSPLKEIAYNENGLGNVLNILTAIEWGVFA